MVFVSAPKDFETLIYSVTSVKQYLQQPISRIVLIAPKSNAAIEISQSLGMEYIDENTILSHKDFTDWTRENKLSHNCRQCTWSWYYQQFLKLLYYKTTKAENYFVIDADIVMNKPFTLISNDGVRTFFTGHNSGHEISKISVQLLLGEEQYVPEFSFIADLMCFNKNIVEGMITQIEKKFNLEFYKAAILVEQASKARFSEYEMYGVYVNFNNDLASSRQLTNYIPLPPKTNCTRKRSTLGLDQLSNELKICHYIAYHYWFN